MSDYSVGDIVTYQAMGGIGERRVLVTYKDEDIKNGRPGFDGDIIGTDDTCWGYDSQIVRIEKQG